MPEAFKSFDMQFTVSVVVDGRNYIASDWDGDEEAFREDMEREARNGMRNVDFDIADCWLDHIEEVTP